MASFSKIQPMVLFCLRSIFWEQLYQWKYRFDRDFFNIHLNIRWINNQWVSRLISIAWESLHELWIFKVSCHRYSTLNSKWKKYFPCLQIAYNQDWCVVPDEGEWTMRFICVSLSKFSCVDICNEALWQTFENRSV